LKLVAKIDSYYLVLRYPDVGDVVPYENVDKEDAEDRCQKNKSSQTQKYASCLLR
jgi:HEPN domain-containing protein